MYGRQWVWDRVEEFRKKHLPSSINSLPVDVFTLVEIELELDMIPFDDLFSKYGVDAALTQDFSGFYVDAEAYILLEKGPVWKQKRLRFSVGHELGHYELHRELAEKQRFVDFDHFFDWIRTSEGQKGRLEEEANEFSGRLLVPRGRLEDHLSKMAAQVEHVISGWRSSAEMQRLFTTNICDTYGVNSEVIRVRLERERLWIVS